MKIKREIIGKIDGDYSLWIRQVYEKFGMEKAEYSFKQSESDFSDNLKRKKSSDNGKTWGNWQDLDKERFMTKGKAEKLKTSARTFFDYKNERIIKILMERIFPQGHHKDYENYSKKGVITWSDHVFLDISSDNGKTWEHQLVKFEDGPDMEPENWLSEAYLKTNHLYFGNRVEIEENGDIIFAVSVGAPALCNVFACELGTTSLGAALVFKGKWNEKTGRYDLTMSQPLFIDGAKSSRGLMEPNVLKLKSGKYLFECRGSNAKSAQKNALTTPDTPGYRWMALSNDGINWSEIKPMTYDTGEKFFSPSSISHIVRSSKNGKAYWVGNINEKNPKGNHWRNPLNIAVIDEETGCLIKDSMRVIDKWEPGQADDVQLSNFTFIENRETEDFEIYLCKLGEYVDEKIFKGNAYKYTISLD